MCAELSANNQMADKNIKTIHQFLLDYDFINTAEVLIQEASKMGFHNFEYELKIPKSFTYLHDQLILYYNTGDHVTFFKLWDKLFIDHIKQCEEYKKLTFNLHVHFAVLPARKAYTDQYKEYETNLEITTSRMLSIEEDSNSKRNKEVPEIKKNIYDNLKQLQDYLRDEGKELEHDVELQPFYTITFIEELHTDSFFSEILEQSWLDELSEKLNLFIINHRKELIDLSYINYDIAESQNLSQDHVAVEITKTASTKLDTQNNQNIRNKIIKDNVPIVPNDRDIPIFEDNNKEECYNFYQEINHLKSKSSQTHIIGNYIGSHEKNIDGLLKLQKQDKRLIHCNRELALTKTHLCNIHTNYEKLKLRFHKLHADYHKLIDVAGELTVALEKSVKGQAIDIQQTLEICMKIFPDLFNQNIRETSYPSLLQLGHINVKTAALPVCKSTTVPISPKLLDFKKIKLHLLNGDVKTKLLLLQALRWKITLVHSPDQDEILHEYISRDLLGLHGQIASDSGMPILPYLLTAGEVYAKHLLQQFTARLLNTLASLRCGRDYLSVGSTLVNVTFTCLNNSCTDEMDFFTCDMLVAMLQKLSLRRQQRIYMIESGLLEWLIHHLHDECRVMTLYRLEYATALLMNLSLHRLAQARVSKISLLLVSTLLILLSLDHTSSLPYINGALNNFLNNPVVNEEARKMNRSDMSNYLGHNKNIEEIRNHLNNILKIQRREDINTPQNEEAADDDNEEFDVLENELDENDPLKNYVGELNGETLLAMCYTVSSKVSQEIMNTDTDIQKISTLNPIDFYNNPHDNHMCSGHLSYPMLRYNIQMNNKALPQKSYNEQTTLRSSRLITDMSYLSDFTIKEPLSVIDKMNTDNLPAHKIRNSTNRCINNNKLKSALYMGLQCQLNKKQNKNLIVSENIIQPSSKIEKINYDGHMYDYKNYIRTKTNTNFVIRNNIEKNDLTSHKPGNKVDVGRLHGVQLEGMELKKLPLKALKSFNQNSANITSSNETICLYKNQFSKDSIETTMTSSMTIGSSRKNDQTEMEKLGSIASLNTNNSDSNALIDESWRNDLILAKEEEAFLAKPKISRTPP